MSSVETETKRKEEESKENRKTYFSLSGCYNKAWVLLTNESQRLDTLICCLCNQIANNAMELHCNQHENADKVYLIGEECVQKYLKQNNGKCPIQQHDHCEFSQNKIVRKFVSELLVICPRQFHLKKRQSNEGIKSGEKEEEYNKFELNSNSNLKCNCNYVGKIKDLKDHLDKSCDLISSQQIIPLEIVNELNVMSEQIKTLQNMIKDLQSQIKKMKENDNEKNKQSIAFKKQLDQCQVKFDEFKEYKRSIEAKFEKQNANIQKFQHQIDTQNEKQKSEQKGQEQHSTNFKFHNCENMLSFVTSINLKNGVDFLLVNENKKRVELKNREWNNYEFGVFLLGENITLTVCCDFENQSQKYGHLKIKTSHLWIKYSSSKIDCSELGYSYLQPRYPGSGSPGKWGGGGGGYATKGGESGLSGLGRGGEIYGEETLLKQIHFGSGGGGCSWNGSHGGSGGGIFELIIEQQLINHGSIQSNGGDSDRGGGGSGGSILIEFRCHGNTWKHTFGIIRCIGGNQSKTNEGGKGRIAIYGIELSSDDIKDIDPKPFNRLHK
ncbi:hypothetical protein RFI_26682 [Reticulomyxa filosa]|uniref:Uncharacterized protein n=1 Tax=Reticulomyxa filosa TaxID=46433 RepID=X6M9L1_RETFI|nr:hypothetical protein RFI_26682 [Reticulomyxa filosa]|eukprot:ETO10693.1 hypothetical protein RFI_26682 [Reticulomyxa filosa]